MRRKKPKDVDGSAPTGIVPILRPHSLTTELLDWGLAALEAIISTPELQVLAEARTKQSIIDAYKYLDRLYPRTVEVRAQAVIHELETRDTGVKVRASEEAGAARLERLGRLSAAGSQALRAEDEGQEDAGSVPEV